MALRAASSVMSYVGPDGCTHTRKTRKVGTGRNATTEHDEFVIACPTCEPTLAGHELWGPADKPAPPTKDEAAQLEAQERAANKNILESLAAIPGLMEEIKRLSNKD